MTRWPYKLDPEFGCWEWQRELDREGYGLSWRGRTRRRAHLAVYEELVGYVPAGLELDHECRNRRCVNPNHLEPVTRSVNELRKSLAYRLNKRTHCRAAGHDLALHGVMTPQGGRVCRACIRGDYDETKHRA